MRHLLHHRSPCIFWLISKPLVESERLKSTYPPRESSFHSRVNVWVRLILVLCSIFYKTYNPELASKVTSARTYFFQSFQVHHPQKFCRNRNSHQGIACQFFLRKISTESQLICNPKLPFSLLLLSLNTMHLRCKYHSCKHFSWFTPKWPYQI